MVRVIQKRNLLGSGPRGLLAISTDGNPILNRIRAIISDYPDPVSMRPQATGNLIPRNRGWHADACFSFVWTFSVCALSRKESERRHRSFYPNFGTWKIFSQRQFFKASFPT